MTVSPPAQYVVGGALDAPFWPTMPETYTKGHILEAVQGSNIHEWIVPCDIELLGIAISCNKYDLYDNWSLSYKGRFLVETCYTKELPEGIHFMSCKQIPAGEKLLFFFENQGAKKVVWFNYQCLRDEVVEELPTDTE